MMKRTLLPALLILMLSQLSVGTASAQDDGTLLPDINPQDIEIRGEFRARFLGLNRQPILGFDPNMQVYQIDPNRMPFMESGNQIVANLPVSELSRPAPPAYSGLDYAEDINFFTRAGMGSYQSPEAKFWGIYHLNPDTYVGGDLDFSSSEGHLDEQPSSFRFLDANLEYGTRINEKTELRVHAGGQSDFNHPAEFVGSGMNEDGVRIEHEGINGGFEVSRFKNEIAGWKGEANIRSFTNRFESDVYGGEVSELAYSGSFANRWALGNPSETIAVEAGGRGGSYEAGDADSRQWGTLQAGVAYERLLNYRTNIHAEAKGYYTKSNGEEQFFPGGLVKVDHWFGDRVKITGKAEGRPQLSTAEQLHEQNRFLGFDNTLMHSYRFDVSGEASIKYYRGSKLHGGVTYSNTQDKLFYSQANVMDAGGEIVDYYNVNYQNATNFKLHAGITHQLLPERFWVSGQVYVQNPELDNGDRVPFEETWGVNASMSFKPIDRITVRGWADVVGERETGVSDVTVEDFLLLGAQLDIEILDQLGGYVKAVNLTDQEYEVWQGYTERPFQVYGGITLKF